MSPRAENRSRNRRSDSRGRTSEKRYQSYRSRSREGNGRQSLSPLKRRRKHSPVRSPKQRHSSFHSESRTMSMGRSGSSESETDVETSTGSRRPALASGSVQVPLQEQQSHRVYGLRDGESRNSLCSSNAREVFTDDLNAMGADQKKVAEPSISEVSKESVETVAEQSIDTTPKPSDDSQKPSHDSQETQKSAEDSQEQAETQESQSSEVSSLNPSYDGKDLEWNLDYEENTKETALRKGAVLRWKYRLIEDGTYAGSAYVNGAQPPAALRTAYSSDVLGWHEKNRSGAGPNGGRCENLLSTFIDAYEVEEADFGAVAVQENPKTPRRFLEHTRLVCEKDDRLAAPKCHSCVGAMVGHSHMNQCMRNILHGAKCNHPSLKDIVDEDNRIVLAKVQARSPALAHHVRTGLQVEMLAYQLELEEPNDGIFCVQASLNGKHANAMAKHEMELLRHLEQIVLLKECRVANQANYELCKQKTAESGWARCAKDREFLGIYSLVINTVTGPWLKRMCQWHEKMIDPTQRRMPFDVLGCLHKIPDTLPHVRFALFKKGYDRKDNQSKDDPVCTALSPTQVKNLCDNHADLMASAEKLLRRFHDEYETKGFYSGVPSADMEHIFVIIDMAIVNALLKAKKDEDGTPHLNKAEAKAESVLRKKLPEENSKKLPEMSKQDCALAKPEKSTHIPLQPILISYQGDQPQDAQPVTIIDTPVHVALNWTDPLLKALNEEVHGKAKILWALQAAAQNHKYIEEIIEIRGRADGKEKLKVLCKVDLQPGKLLLIPLQSSMGTIIPKAQKNQRDDNVPMGEFCLQNCVSRKAGQEFMPPFWCVRRSCMLAECNVLIDHLNLNAITSLLQEGADDQKKHPNLSSALHHCEVSCEDTKIPVITNATKIMQGDELVLFKQKIDKDPKSKKVGWQEKVQQRK